MACIIVGCLGEVVGYAGRILMYYNPWGFAEFIMQIVFITSGPLFYTMSVYVTLSKT